MRRVEDLSAHELADRLKSGRLCFRVGPYTYGLKTRLDQIADGLQRLYADFALASPSDFIDFPIEINHSGLRSVLRKRADFYFDEQRAFGAIPTSQAYAFTEWGMNWCIASHVNEYLKLHAAAVAKNNRAIIMPGIPGAGKSTLCAALGLNGWRILSDEHALIPPGSGNVMPLCRPVSLKNESISIIKAFDQNAVIGPECEATHKGTVAHMKADLSADSHDIEPLPARVMLFPRFSGDEQQRLIARRRSTSFVHAACHAFNYSTLGEDGFNTMKILLDAVDCYDLVYHDLDWALGRIEDLHDKHSC